MIFHNPFKLFTPKKKPSEPAKHAKRNWKKKEPLFSF